MKKIWIATVISGCCALSYNGFADVNVPFTNEIVCANKNLTIDYDNTTHGNYDAIICSTTEYNYNAIWTFKDKKMASRGPNYFNQLVLCLGQPPECPNGPIADQKGKIKIHNHGKSFLISCVYSSMGPPPIK